MVPREAVALDAPFEPLPGLTRDPVRRPGKVPLWLEGDEPGRSARRPEATVGVMLEAGAQRDRLRARAAPPSPTRCASGSRALTLLLFDGTVLPGRRDDAAPASARRPAGAWATCRCRGPDGSIAALAGVSGRPAGLRPHQQHQPDPGRGLGRAPARRGRRAGRSATTGWRSTPDDRSPAARPGEPAEAELRCATSARAATTTCTRSTACCTAASSRRDQVRAWALNRYYYQAMIPMKDATILARMHDPALRRDLAPAHRRP